MKLYCMCGANDHKQNHFERPPKEDAKILSEKDELLNEDIIGETGGQRNMVAVIPNWMQAIKNGLAQYIQHEDGSMHQHKNVDVLKCNNCGILIVLE